MELIICEEERQTLVEIKHLTNKIILDSDTFYKNNIFFKKKQ